MYKMLRYQYMFGQAMLNVSTLTDNLLKRSGRSRTAIRKSRGEGRARRATLEYTGS